MRYSTIVLALLAATKVGAYVQRLNTNTDSSETLQRLQSRADTCPSKQPVSCSAVDSGLPKNFCCGSDTVCQSIDRSSSAICCPTGQSCDTIGLINCDISLQDPSKNAGPIFTTRLNDKLPTCGDKCCPFGYACAQVGDQPVCLLNKADAGSATTTKITSTTSTTATSTSNAIASGIDSNNPTPTKTSSFPAGVFFAGFFPGILVGVLATLAWVVLTKRNNPPPTVRGLNLSGDGARPFISMPMKDARHSNERSDFLGRTRSRARSMFSTHRRSRTVDSPDIWAAKMPTPPPHNNVPINYVNDMPDVPVTPRRRVARYPSDDNFSRAIPENDSNDLSPAVPNVSNSHRPETIRIYSPDLVQQQNNPPAMPQMPMAAIPPLRGMNVQRRISPEYGSSMPPQHLPRRDSGTAMGTFGSPFQTPEKKPTIINNNTPSMHVTYHDATTFESPVEPPVPQTLTPARYEPVAPTSVSTLAPSSAAAFASAQLSKAQKGPSSQQSKQPIVPPRPQNKRSKARPETQCSDFDFDEGLDHDNSPTQASPPREAYQSQAISNPYKPRQFQNNVDPNTTFDYLIPDAPSSQFDKSKKDKHATNATTFTTMLRNVGFPDPGDQVGKRTVPQVPKLDMAKVKGKMKANGKMKGMI